MLEEGKKLYPEFVYSNSLSMEDGKFWYKSPKKYKLVYRGYQYIYVPLKDKRSTERRGGEWCFAIQGFNLEPYADNLSFCFENYNTCDELQSIFSNAIVNLKFPIWRSQEITLLFKSFFAYCSTYKVDALKYIMDFKSINKNVMHLSRASWNSRMKPYYQINLKTKDIEPYSFQDDKSRKTSKILAKITALETKIQFLKNKMKNIELSQHL